MKPFKLQAQKIAVPFNVDKTYFKNLSAEILERIKAQQIDNGVDEEATVNIPQLDSKPKIALPYAVPKNYFNALPQQLIAAISKESPHRITFLSSIKKYANVAAIIFLVCVGGIYFLAQNNSNTINSMNESQILSALQEIDVTALKTHLNTYEQVLYADDNDNESSRNQEGLYTNAIQVLLNETE